MWGPLQLGSAGLYIGVWDNMSISVVYVDHVTILVTMYSFGSIHGYHEI